MIFSAVLLGGSMMAQVNVQSAPIVKNNYERDAYNVELPTPNADRDVFWTNTFSDPNDWTPGDFGPVGLTFEVGTGLTTGGGAPIAEVNSTTYGDGVAMVDSDEFANQTAIENCWIQTAAPINCTDHPYVMIEFETQYRMWDGGASDGNEYCLLEVSTDGETWPDVETYEVADADPGTRFELWPNMETQDFVANPTKVRFNISELAGGAPTVYLRFRWVGTYGYAWFIDDVELFDGFANDISIEGNAFANGASYTNVNGTKFVAIEEVDGEIITGLEYYQYPEAQRPDIMAYTPVINWGDNDMTNVLLTGTFNGEENTSEAIDLPAGEANDSLSVLQWSTDGLAPGDYDFSLEVAGDVMDDDMSNNTATAGLEMTEFIMARDDNRILGAYPFTANLGDAFQSGALYEIFEDATIYAVDFALMNNSVEGEELTVSLRDGSQEDLEAAVLVESDEYELTDLSNLNDFGTTDASWYTITLDEPLDVTAGDLIVPVVSYFSGAGIQIGEAQTDAEDNTSYIFIQDEGDWFFTNDMQMVRLNFDPNASSNLTSVEEISDLSFDLGQNVPNPSTGLTSINYSLTQAGEVTFQVMDITGKVISSEELGKQGVGSYSIELETSDYPAGMYNYTLSVDGEKATKRMIVQ